jgi:GDPmannose 4,6-dehydratase
LSKKILITGVGGQDGYFLTKLLLERGDTVHGLLRGGSEDEIGSLKFLGEAELARISIHRGDVTEKWFVDELIQRELFDEVFHLAAQSSVARSIEHPRETIDTNVLGLTNIATSIRDRSPKTKLLFTGSSEMFGNLTDDKQSEQTPRHPQSPYGLTKDFGFQLINAYRKHYGLWAATAILFNHESDVMALELPDDFVFATGQLHSVKDFVNLAFKHAGIKPEWSGEGLDEIAHDPSSGKVIVKIDERFYRPGDIKGSCGDSSKAERILGWQAKTDLDTIIERMLRHEQGSATV